MAAEPRGWDSTAFVEPIGWAIVELLGHRRLAGYVSAEDFAGSGFLRIATPAEGDTYTVTLVPPASVYAMTPATEETARAAAASGGFRPEPVSPFSVAPRAPGDMEIVTWLEGGQRLERALRQLRERGGWVPTDDSANAAAIAALLPYVDLPF